MQRRSFTLPIILSLLFTLLSFTAQAEQSNTSSCPRIISQSPYITKSLQWLGLESCIVGVSRYDEINRPHTGGLFDPDGEAIDSLMPDLIFTSNWTKPDVLKSVTPEGVRAFRLDGFESMGQIEDNLHLIGNETKISDIDQRVKQFHQQWQQLATQVNGQGKRVLLISSCSGMPYSFGKKRWLTDLFSQSGFIVVETAEKIRHIKPGEEVVTINALINELQPELLFIFERTKNKQCAFIKPKTPLTIINLDGEKFLHPAPILLEGLAELIEQRKQWQES